MYYNYVPSDAGWRTATTPRKFELPFSPAALPNVTTRSAHPTLLGGGRAKPCRQAVLSGKTRSGRNPRRAHTHGVDRGQAPRATNTSCVTKSLLARVKRLKATLSPRPFISSVPLAASRKPSSDTLTGPSEHPPQTPSKDPQKAPPSGLTGHITRRTTEVSNIALSRGRGRVLRDTLAAPRGQGRGVT